MEPEAAKARNGEAPLLEWSSTSPEVIRSPNNNSTLKVPEVNFRKSADSIASTTTSIAIDSDQTKSRIPDGGWGWVVVLSSLIVSMIADGISFSFGLLYIEFLQEFGASKSVTSWIGSLFVSVPLLTGPIMSALVDRYGCRAMTIVGGIISAIGFILSSFGKSIVFMYLTFGVIAGAGLGLCYVTAVVSVAYWFDKRRSLATGLGACGTGIGTFLYAPMTQYWLSEYGWRGTVLLLSGTFLNIIVCGAVMRDPEWLEEENKQKSLKNASSTVSMAKSVSEVDIPNINEIRKLLKSSEKPEYLLKTLVMSLNSCDDAAAPKSHHRSVINLPTFVKQNEKVPLEVLEQLSENKNIYKVILENYPSLLSCRSTSLKNLSHVVDDDSPVSATRIPVTMSMKIKKTKNNRVPKEATEDVTSKTPMLPHRDSLRWMKDSLPQRHHHFKNIKLHKNSFMYRGAMLNIPRYRLRASSCPDIYRNSMTTLAQEEEEMWYDDILELFKSMVDFSLFLELHFLLLSVSTMLLFTWFIVPYFYLADHMTNHNYSESQISFVLSNIGITNFIGMVGLGWAGDKPWMNVKRTYAVCLVLCGLSCGGMMYFTDNYLMLVISAASFGLFFASNYSFTPAIVVELISLERFTTAYGLLLLSQGIGHLIGPPLAGLLFDLTGSWDNSFWQANTWLMVAGVLIFLITCTKNRRLFSGRQRDISREVSSFA